MMKSDLTSTTSLSEVNASVETNVPGGYWRRLLAFLGPAYLVSVGYMDPGNWATDLAGGSRFGYRLLWVLLMSNLIALLLQSMCARLGVVARRDLAQASRDLYNRFTTIFLYVLAEIAIAATDLAEVLGMAIGLQLLFGIPLTWGVTICVLDAFLLLFLMNWGIRKLEAFIITLILIVGVAFAIQMFFAQPSLSGIAGGLVPGIPNHEALFIAIGIIGATVMPHNLYLHSALVQTRKIDRSDASLRRAIKFNIIDSAIALNLALFVNSAILILAAAVFHKNGYNGVSEIQDAHQLLAPLLGTQLAPLLFAVALIAAGQSSTITGTLAGQIVMEGYLHLRIAPWLRRIITRLLAVVPALLVIHGFGESATGNLLIFSQVVLSMQLGFAIVPLLHYVSDRRRMGKFAIGFWAKLGGWVSASVIVFLNAQLVWEEVYGFRASGSRWAWLSDWVFVPLLIFVAVMLVYIIIKPLIDNAIHKNRVQVPHGVFVPVENLPAPEYREIAIAVDFSKFDEKTISHALHIGGTQARYILLHVVESAGAIVMGSDIADFEAKTDTENLKKYADYLTASGYRCEALIGYGSAKSILPKIVAERNVDLLVMGAHGHRVLQDLIFGSTIDAVRHAVSIPVLVVQ